MTHHYWMVWTFRDQRIVHGTTHATRWMMLSKARQTSARTSASDGQSDDVLPRSFPARQR
jgi:hypothetical protein